MASPARLFGAELWPLSRPATSDPGISPLVQVTLPLTGTGDLAAAATLASRADGLMDGSGVLPCALLAATPTTTAAATTAASTKEMRYLRDIRVLLDQTRMSLRRNWYQAAAIRPAM